MRPRACSSALSRFYRRPRSTSPLELRARRKLSWTRAEAKEALRRAESLAERAAAGGDRVGELCGRLQHGIILTYIAPEGATEQLDALVVAGAARAARGCRRRRRAVHRVPALADGPRSAVAGRTLRATRTTWQPFTRGGPASSTSTWAGVRSAASTGRPPWPSCSRGSTPTSHEPATTTGIRAYAGRWPLAMARPIRRGTRDAGRRAGGARGARRRAFCSAGSPRSSPNKVEQLRRRCRRRGGVRSTGLQACSSSSATRAFLSSAASCLAQALYRLDRLDEAETWAVARGRARRERRRLEPDESGVR